MSTHLNPHMYSFTQPKRMGRVGWSFLMLIGVAMMVVLFFTKTRALEAKAELRQLQHVVLQEKAAIKMLEAEIAHLESPQRVHQLAKTHLQLEPVPASRVLTMDAAAALFLEPENTAIGGTQ
jgi:cell division protein FtsL